MKTMLCTCEDVSADDITEAIGKGYRDIESVKRYTGFGTGMCQGKQCHAAVASLLAARAEAPMSHVLPFTPRPPLNPTELSYWASAPFDPATPVRGGVPAALGVTPGVHPLKPDAPVRPHAQVVIIGAGIMGLALAYNLMRRGVTDVVLLEKGYLCHGASGRNGGGVRMQWGTATNIALARRSIELMKGFAKELGMNVWLRQGGYLFLAKGAKVAATLERAAELHNRHGVNTRLLSLEGARDLVPGLSMKGVELAAFNEEDGVIFPWAFLWGYAQALAKKRVKVETFTRVTGFELSEGRVKKVITDRGEIACEVAVLAAGAWSPSIAALAGVRLPNEPHRHEICSSEPLKPFLGPLVSVLDSGLYFSQSMRGEIVGGMGDPNEPSSMELGSTMRFLSRYASGLLEQMPQLGQVKILRQWSGPYDVTPDNSPILGRTPQLPNLLQMSGFVGHGFMMAPAVAERMAAWMCTGQPDELFTRFNLDRFAAGRLEREDMIIG
jgi:sarcosine oxidase subunit beta